MSQKFIQSHLYQRSVLSCALYPLSLLYALVQSIRRLFYRLKPPSPIPNAPRVIGIGNVVSGGSGKTPFTMFLAGYLKENGKHPAICLRGYRGKFEYNNRIISNMQEVLPEAVEAGDEARMLAEKLPGVPVAVGAKRRNSIAMLMNAMPQIDCILLDDSFQHLKVSKDLMFVVFGPRGAGNGFVLPAGILREPLSSLKHADCIVINGGDWNPPCNQWNKPVLRGENRLDRIYGADGNEIALEDVRKKKVLLLSGIGNPSSFEQTMRGNDIDFKHHLAMGDHYDYTQPGFIPRLEKELAAHGCDMILTTEKDWAKLSQLELSHLPLAIVAVRFEVENQEALSQLLNSLS